MKSLIVLVTLGLTSVIVHGLTRILPISAIHCPPHPQCEDPPIDCHYVPDANGCPTCNLVCARAVHCPPVCDIFCLNGNVLDDNGCPTCRCEPPSTIVKRATEAPDLECHTWMKCAQGVCPYTCSCQPNC